MCYHQCPTNCLVPQEESQYSCCTPWTEQPGEQQGLQHFPQQVGGYWLQHIGDGQEVQQGLHLHPQQYDGIVEQQVGTVEQQVGTVEQHEVLPHGYPQAVIGKVVQVVVRPQQFGSNGLHLATWNNMDQKYNDNFSWLASHLIVIVIVLEK